MGLRGAFFSLALTASCFICYIIIDPMGWLKDRFPQTHYHTNGGLINNPLLQTVFSSTNNNNKHFKSNQMHQNDNKNDFNSSNTTIPINKIQNQWQRAFHDIFINFELLPSFQNTSYQTQIHANHPHTFNFTQNILRFNHLLNTTHRFCIQQNITNKLVILTHHRQIISIRRYMMILYKYLLSKNHHNINIDTYERLIHMFINIRIAYKHTIQHDPQYTKFWHLIHVSKSAGTSICSTQRDVGYTQLREGGTNCNIPGLKAPIKNEDSGDLSCSDLEHIRKTEGVEFIASERPMTGYKISSKPILCNKYHYILPIRNPLRRIASTLSEYNSVAYFPFQILTKYGTNDQSVESKLKCFEKRIVLNNNTYGSLRSVGDYKDFISYLFENKLEWDDDVDIVWHDNYKCMNQSTLDKSDGLYKSNDMTYINWLGADRKYAIKTTEGFKHRSNISLLRGYCSNTYTRWIGYERDILHSESTYDAIFEKSYNINMTHWFNAIDFLMITDYVLPFKSIFEHAIFKFALRDLWDFKPKRKRVFRDDGNRNKLKKRDDLMRRRMQAIKKRVYGVGRGRLKRPRSVSKTSWKHSHVASDKLGRVASAHVIDSWSEKEIAFINSKNLLDIQLFDVAMWIADVDAVFYNYFAVEQTEA